MKGVEPRKTLSVKNLLSRGIPRLFVHATLDQYDIDRKIKRIIRNYLEEIDLMFKDAINLLFFGPNGVGKSFCASLIVKEAYKERYSSMMITFQSLLDLQFKKHDPGVKELLNECYAAEFLVIDEIGKETITKSDFGIGILEEVLRIRDTRGFPTILCTNMDKESLYDKYGQSIASLIEGNFVKLEFKDGDFRKIVTQERKGIKVLLGEED